MTDHPHSRHITAQEVANYVVCPEAWRLKYLVSEQKHTGTRSVEGRRLRAAWVEGQDLSEKLRLYAKFAYGLLVVLVFGAFLLEQQVERRRALKKRVMSVMTPVAPDKENGR